MRSTETVSNPAARAVSTAARARSPSWRRPRKRRASSEKDCTPRDRVRTPRPRHAAQATGRHVLGVGLQEDPGRRRELQVLAAGVEHACEVPGGEERGCAAAEVHGVEGRGVRPRAGGEGHLGHEVIDEALPRRQPGAQDREVAVRADGRAEGNVEIEPGSPRSTLPRQDGGHSPPTIAPALAVGWGYPRTCSPGSPSTKHGPRTAPFSPWCGAARSGRCATTDSSSCRAATHGSEDELTRLGFAKVPHARTVLIGGLGLGFSLRAALDLLGPRGKVVVAEQSPVGGGVEPHPRGLPRGAADRGPAGHGARGRRAEAHRRGEGRLGPDPAGRGQRPRGPGARRQRRSVRRRGHRRVPRRL